jgi:hypothetical protein
MANEDNLKTVYIGWKKLFSTIFSFLVSAGFNIYYTYSYVEVSPDLRNTTFFKCFLAMIIMQWIVLIDYFMKIVRVIEFFDHTIIESIWEKLQYSNIFPFTLLNWVTLGIMCLGCYFIKIFIPFRDCVNYPQTLGYYNVCVSMKMISFFVMFAWCALALVFLIFLCGGCCIICVRIVDDQHRAAVRRENLNFATRYLRSYVPIPSPSRDIECSICKISVEEDGKKEWTKLACGHKFHALCITEWMKYAKTCPYCRRTILQPSSVLSPV